jgi:hypothetical protein
MANIVVIPTQVGIQYFTGFLDARVRGHDNVRLLQTVLRQVLAQLSGFGLEIERVEK